MVAGAISLFGIPLLRETYAPAIRARKLKQANDPEKMAKARILEANTDKWLTLRQNLVRPIVLLTRSLICFLLSLYMALYVTFPICLCIATMTDLHELARTAYTVSCVKVENEIVKFIKV